MNSVITVKPLDSYQVYLEFSDGTTGVVDLSEYAGKGVFSIWSDYSVFQQVKIGSSGELTWKDTADLCPDTLYMKIRNLQPEDIFSSLRRESVDA